MLSIEFPINIYTVDAAKLADRIKWVSLIRYYQLKRLKFS